MALRWVGLSTLVVVFNFGSAALAAGERDWAGFVSVEPRIFFEDPAFADQSDAHFSPSGVLAPEFRYEWSDGNQRITLAPFFRWDADDDARTHFDLREASWQYLADPWTIQVGLSKVFWGVTESRHLVDIVNQTDLVEDIDEEEKLGQPMIELERWSKSGTISLFVLPGFRERTFPDEEARLSGGFDVAGDAEYESGAEDRHVDAALRWQHVLGNWDIGISGFYGTSREPRLVPTLKAPSRIVLAPHYDIIGQLGVDVQYTRDAWLWKFEGITRAGHGDTFGALVGGFEYTRFGIFGTPGDLGLLLEYLYDGRDDDAPLTLPDDDVFIGSRFTLNDPDDSALLVGAIVDLDGDGVIGFLEVERRLGDVWKLEVEARIFIQVEAGERFLGRLRKDSFLTLRLARFL